MLFGKVIFLALTLLCQLAAAGAAEKTELLDKVDRVSMYSCYNYLRKQKWQYTLPKGVYFPCDYQPALASLLYCMNQNIDEHGHSKKTLERGFEDIRVFCSAAEVANMTDSWFYDSLSNGTNYILDKQIPGANITYPIKVKTDLRKAYYHAYHGFYLNRDIGNYFGGIICAYFVGVMLFAGLVRFLRRTPVQNIVLKLKIVNYLRGYGLIPNLGKSHAQPFTYFKIITGYLPTRFETLVIVVYLALHTAFMACNYQYDPQNVLFKSKTLQIARYVGDRSAVLSFAHFPLIVLFAGRNNFLEWISGIPYTSFIVFHKWVGRIMFLDAIIHGVAYTHYVIIQKTYSSSLSETYWRFGVVALVFAGVLTFTSFAYFRRHFYETFLILHIIFGALFFYACWEHVMILSGIEWVYAAIALWCVDRLVRVIRLFFFGFPKANVRVIGSDLVRVDIQKTSKLWHAKPGQYVFVYFLHPRFFWQSHPFTVMDSCSKDGQLTIIFREKAGVTKYMRNVLAKNNDEMQLRVAIEGPYGTASPAHHFDNILLLTGGVGLPGPVYHAIELGKTCAASGKKKVQLVAAVKGIDALEAFKPELMVLKDLPIDVHIFDTSKKALPQKSTTSDDDSNLKNLKNEEGVENEIEKLSSNEALQNTISSDGSVADLGFASFHEGRPDCTKLLNDLGDQPGSLAVVCCGPPIFVDSVRNATAKKIIEKPNSVIEYFEEYQAW